MKTFEKNHRVHTKFGILHVTDKYVSHYDIYTGQEILRTKESTTLRAEWLTKEMANQFFKWADSGYRDNALIPSFFLD